MTKTFTADFAGSTGIAELSKTETGSVLRVSIKGYEFEFEMDEKHVGMSPEHLKNVGDLWMLANRPSEEPNYWLTITGSGKYDKYEIRLGKWIGKDCAKLITNDCFRLLNRRA